MLLSMIIMNVRVLKIWEIRATKKSDGKEISKKRNDTEKWIAHSF